MSNGSSTRQTKIVSVMSSAPFVAGFNEARKGIPFDPQRYEGVYLPASKGRNAPRVCAAWRYERGRRFAIIYPGTLKTGHNVNPEAVEAYANEINARAIR